MDESFDPLKCNEDLSSSPGCHMDYGKVPRHSLCGRNRFSLCCTSTSLWTSPQMTCQTCRRWRRTRGPQGCTTLVQECPTRSSAAPPAPTGWLNWPTLPLVLKALYWKTSHIRGLICAYTLFIHWVHVTGWRELQPFITFPINTH